MAGRCQGLGAGGNGEFVFNRDIIAVWGRGRVLEMVVEKGHSNVDGLDTAELYA